ncbi:leucine-rich repeat-containing protein 71-like isoform X3 [Clytia hemisphaerica]|uniref:Leucine rich repeat containing protein n=1 Tax=Clytia hemisphaerica TaxID=252671 RepID=A0A7M5UFY6_9CNID
MLASIVKIRAGGRSSSLSSPPVEPRRRSPKKEGSFIFSSARKRSLENKMIGLVSVHISIDASEKYKPTGDFEKDFVELCTLVGIQSLCVVARPKRPGTPSTTSTSITTGKGGKNAPPATQQPQQDANNNNINGDGPPTTYIIAKNKYDYFKPRVEIETEEEANRIFVKELYIRGWRVEQKVIDVLAITMPELERLTLVDFWNAGLTDETVVTLGHCLSAAPSLKTLRLDGNSHASSQRFDIFLSEKSMVQNLSLKNCCITDLGAQHIGNSLKDNRNLATLNLCFNKITDEGVSHLAKGLRINRSLLSLNLGSNQISDDGAKHISEVLSTFQLTHEEIVQRRQLRSTHIPDDGSSSPSQTSTSHDRPPTATRSFSKDDKKNNAKNKDKKKEPANKLKENGLKRGPSNVDSSTTSKQKTPKGKGGQKQDRGKTPQHEVEEVVEFKNPLLENVREEDGALWIPGNKALINLNLARNSISEVGLEHLYEAVKYQSDMSIESNKTSLGTGLMRLSLQRNKFLSMNPTYLKLVDLMKTRDPFYEPTPPSPIEESSKEDHERKS